MLWEIATCWRIVLGLIAGMHSGVKQATAAITGNRKLSTELRPLNPKPDCPEPEDAKSNRSVVTAMNLAKDAVAVVGLGLGIRHRLKGSMRSPELQLRLLLKSQRLVKKD